MIPLAAVIGAATAVGVGAERRFGDGAERLARRLMQVVLWGLLPVVAFVQVTALELTAEVGAGIAFAYAGVALALALAYAVGTFLLRLPRPSVGALMNVSALGNTGYLGLPFAVAVFGFDALPNAVAYDALVSAVALVTVGFAVGAACGTAADRPRDLLRALLTRNPPAWATVAGLLAPSALAPGWAVTASQALVVLILPLGFFAVGVILAAEREHGATRFPPPLDAPVACAAALKLLVPPAVVFALSRALVDVPEVYLTQAGMASAINTIVVAHAYGLDRRLTASAIAWTTALVVAAGLVAALV